MHDQTMDTEKLSRSQLARQPAQEQRKEADSNPVSAAQHDPALQLSCRLGDASCAGAHSETVNRRVVQRSPDALLRLQRQYGNRFVQRVVDLSRQGEGEADVGSDVEQDIQSARGGGQGLSSGVRAQMESAFDADFSGVRVHNNAQSDNLNQSLSARAFTTGQDVFFKQGEYNPGSSGGRELIAHELTHVVQQNSAVQKNSEEIQTKLTLGQVGDRYEQEADQVAHAVMQQESQPVQKQNDEGMLQRQDVVPDEEDESLQAKLQDNHLQRQGEALEEEEEGAIQAQSIEEEPDELQG